jgi:hypothetical protein
MPNSLNIVEEPSLRTTYLTDPGEGYVGVVLPANSTFEALSVKNVGPAFVDTFANSSYTSQHWRLVNSNATAGNGWLTVSSSREGAAMPGVAAPLSNFEFETSIAVDQGGGGGMYVGSYPAGLSGFQFFLHPTWGNGALQVINVTDGIGSTVTTLPMPLVYGQDVEIGESVILGNLTVSVNGVEVFGSQIDGDELAAGYLVGSGTCSFSKLTIDNLTAEQFSPLENDTTDTQTSFILSIPPQGSVELESDNNISGIFLADSPIDPLRVLSPPLVQLTVSSENGWGSWNINTSYSGESFVVARYVDFPGWSISPQGECYLVDAYAVGCEFEGAAVLAFNTEYPEVALGTAVALSVAGVLSIFTLVMTYQVEGRNGWSSPLQHFGRRHQRSGLRRDKANKGEVEKGSPP